MEHSPTSATGTGWERTQRALKRTDQQMTRASVVLPVLLVLRLVSGALAFDDPDGFRGFQWGATEEQLRTNVGGWCEDYLSADRWAGDRHCKMELEIGGIGVWARYTFRADKFVRVNLTFSSKDFEHLAAIFGERYGPPTSTIDEPYKTQGGLQSTNRSLKWTGPTVMITIQQYGGRITEGSASLGTRADLQEASRLRKERTKGAAKDL